MWLCTGVRMVHRSISMHTLQRMASTIFALSSGYGKCGVAVVRVSGDKASQAILKMTQSKQMPKPRLATLQSIHDPSTQEILDKGLVLWFPGPHSFTGEDCCELQVHGGPAVVAAILSALSKIKTYRPAEPGEFTKRAFQAGKLDLTQVEGLGDLIHAETELQRKQALLQMEGSLSKVYHSWRELLLKSVAHVEAYIDFSEEENIEEDALEKAKQNLINLKKEIRNHLSDGRRGERLRDGIRTVILGAPNAGKSSLLNALCQRPAAIVTPIPGTTRDIVELPINIEGYPVLLADTAGIHTKTSDIVEKEGVSRAYSQASFADLVILVLDATKCAILHEASQLESYIEQHIAQLELTHVLKDKQYVIVFNKTDLLTEEQANGLKRSNVLPISCVNQHGFTDLFSTLSNHFKTLCVNPTTENPSITQARHRYHLTECASSINTFFTLTTEAQMPVAAHHLRSALRHLSKITGQVSSEEILDLIFKDFCIGK